MKSDKITISMDDVNRADPVPGLSAPHPTFPEYDPDPPPRNRTGLFVGIGIAVGLVLCGIIVAAAVFLNEAPAGGGGGTDTPPTSPKRVRTVDDVRAEVKRELKQELSSPTSSLGQQLKERIEKAHVTVTVTSAQVVRVDVTTVDGSNLAGEDDGNVKTVTMLIRFNWQGILDSGYTDLKVVRDAYNDRTESAIEYTTALFNTEDPGFWFDVGAIIGTALAF